MKKGLYITTLVLICALLLVGIIITGIDIFSYGFNFDLLMIFGINVLCNISLAVIFYLAIYCIKALATKNYKANKFIINTLIIPVVYSILHVFEVIAMMFRYGSLPVENYLNILNIFVYISIFLHFYHNLYHGKDNKTCRIMFLVGCLVKIVITFVPLIMLIVDSINHTYSIWPFINYALRIITYTFILFAFYDTKVEVKQGEAKKYSKALGVDLAIKIPMTVVVALLLILCIITCSNIGLFIVLLPAIVFYAWVYEAKLAKILAIIECGIFVILFVLSFFSFRFYISSISIFSNIITTIFGFVVTIVLLVLTIVLDKTGRRQTPNVYYAPNPYPQPPIYNNYQRPVVPPVKEDKYDKLLKSGEITTEDYITLKKEKSKKDKYEVLLENGSITKEEYETLKKTKTKKKKESK